MADLFEFMLGKKEKNQHPKPEPVEDSNNYAIYMPVGVYDDSEEENISHKTNEDINNKSNQDSMNSRRGDFDFYDNERLKNEDQLTNMKRKIVDMEDTIKKLNKIIIDLKNENSALQVESSKFEYIKSTYRNMIEKIVKIMPYYHDIEFTGIGVPEQWKDKDLVEIFIKCVEDIKMKYNKALKDIEITKAKSNTVLNEVKEDNKNVPLKNKQSIELDIPEDIENNLFDEQPDNIDNISSSDFSNGINIEIPDENEILANGNNDNLVSPIGNESLLKYKSKLDEDEGMKIIIETIGSTGLSQIASLKDIEKFEKAFISNNGEFSQGNLSKKMQNLCDLDIISKETISTGRKGSDHIYSLTNLGIQLYELIFSKPPVENEKEAIKRQHTSLEHGYFIKAVGKEFAAKEYTVYDKPDDCIRKPLISKADGDEKTRVEADLIAVKGDDEYLIECEMGTTAEADMNKKLDKLVLVTKTINFMMNNNESLKATSDKVDKWISKNGGPKNFKGYTFRFTTLDTFKKRDVWQNKGPF